MGEFQNVSKRKHQDSILARKKSVKKASRSTSNRGKLRALHADKINDASFAAKFRGFAPISLHPYNRDLCLYTCHVHEQESLLLAYLGSHKHTVVAKCGGKRCAA